MKRVIAINGSPRVNGNTNKLVSTITAGAREKGAETKIINLGQLSIKGCVSCYYCRKNDGCAIKDDMQEIYKDIKKADSVILGSPIYMWQMTSQTKTFIDRLFACWTGETEPSKLQGKECVLAITQGAAEDYFKEYINATAKMLEFLGFKVKEPLIAKNMNNTALDDNKAILAAAYSVGQSLA
jgi:multimeric flavodoxin WrbA